MMDDLSQTTFHQMIFTDEMKFEALLDRATEMEKRYRIINEMYINKYGSRTIVFIKDFTKYVKLSYNKYDLKDLKQPGYFNSEFRINLIRGIAISLDSAIDYLEQLHQRGFNIILTDNDSEKLVYLSTDTSILWIEI